VSSIRLFVLGSLDERGEMHGHALRLLAEEEHVDSWADVTPGAIYGVIKRLLSEGLIETVRVEREGNYPERQVFAITERGTASLREIREQALTTIVHRPDPVDLALTRLGHENLEVLRETITARIAELHARVEAEEALTARIAHHLTLMERHVVRHDLHRLQGEIAWHKELLEALPEIIADEKSRKGSPHV